MYKAVSDFKYFELLASEVTITRKDDLLKKEMILESAKSENYFSSLGNIASTTLFLKVNFNLRSFFTSKNKDFILENIPYSFSSKMFYDILFITFREFAATKKNLIVQICENCNKYFIPLTAHDTKYCDSLFDGKKTCKEIGANKTHKENLRKNDLLKRYRRRGQTLCDQASKCKPGSKSKAPEMYAYFKEEGPKMRKKYIKGIITADEFEAWLDSTMLRKKEN